MPLPQKGLGGRSLCPLKASPNLEEMMSNDKSRLHSWVFIIVGHPRSSEGERLSTESQDGSPTRPCRMGPAEVRQPIHAGMPREMGIWGTQARHRAHPLQHNSSSGQIPGTLKVTMGPTGNELKPGAFPLQTHPQLPHQTGSTEAVAPGPQRERRLNNLMGKATLNPSSGGKVWCRSPTKTLPNLQL